MSVATPAASRISVAMATYNGARYLEEQLASFVAQSCLPAELVVCDDCSTDETVAILHDFARRAPFPVHLRVSERNRGSTISFADSIARCSGELIALSDQDDVWSPEKLARCEEALRRHPAAGAVFTDARVVDDQLADLGYSLWAAAGFGAAEQARFRSGDGFDVLLKNQVVTGATLVFRAALRQLLLPIPPSVVHDGWIALLVAATSGLVAVDEPLMLYRQHTSNQIGIRKLSWLQRLLRSRPAGVPAYLTVAHDRARLAIERLEAHGALTAATRERLRDVARHLRARTDIPSTRPRRLPVVALELASGRYFRYSNGFRSAAEDLLRQGALDS